MAMPGTAPGIAREDSTTESTKDDHPVLLRALSFAVLGIPWRSWSLGGESPASAGRLHAVWLPEAMATPVAPDAVPGLQVMVRRLARIRRKAAREVAVFALAAHLLVLYFG